MNIRIDAFSKVPVYKQIIEQITHQISLGVLKDGDRISDWLSVYP